MNDPQISPARGFQGWLTFPGPAGGPIFTEPSSPRNEEAQS